MTSCRKKKTAAGLNVVSIHNSHFNKVATDYSILQVSVIVALVCYDAGQIKWRTKEAPFHISFWSMKKWGPGFVTTTKTIKWKNMPKFLWHVLTSKICVNKIQWKIKRIFWFILVIIRLKTSSLRFASDLFRNFLIVTFLTCVKLAPYTK